ncbi:hypothetical protein J2W35_003278 [Variovorax boronicumulans]|uniref:hypothetical protein n=1 Tax=Variovorax boronicumulans TaxID=436515 RepID=UPI00277D9ABF|nr:hypothetical protein [Variovorax boronicumulans]MDQ0082919.1 hypothetical protein [Variovorax boronicumulans]
MNCQPGDTAHIVAPYIDIPMRGLPVYVVGAHAGGAVRAKNGDISHDRGQACWLVDGHDSRLPMIIGDQYLRPFRDPGDSVVDETLLMVRIPEFDTV